MTCERDTESRGFFDLEQAKRDAREASVRRRSRIDDRAMTARIDRFVSLVASDYFRPEAPSFGSCYRRAALLFGEAHTLPPKEVRRRLKLMPDRFAARRRFHAYFHAYYGGDQ